MKLISIEYLFQINMLEKVVSTHPKGTQFQHMVLCYIRIFFIQCESSTSNRTIDISHQLTSQILQKRGYREPKSNHCMSG